MANTKQAKKMVKQTAKKTTYNKWLKSRIKTAEKALTSNADKAKSKDLYGKLQKSVDKAVKNNVIHKNKGNRIKSQATKLLQS